LTKQVIAVCEDLFEKKVELQEKQSTVWRLTSSAPTTHRSTIMSI